MEDFDFETAMKRLKEIVTTLEDDLIPLDKAMELFEEGTVLTKKLRSYINNAKQRVEIYSKELVDGLDEDEQRNEKG